MSLEQQKKDLLIMRAMIKKRIQELVYVQEQGGRNTEEDVAKLLDRFSYINKILEELEKKK